MIIDILGFSFNITMERAIIGAALLVLIISGAYLLFRHKKRTKIQGKTSKKGEKKEESVKLGMGVVLFGDHTYIARQFDVRKDRTLTYDGTEYEVPAVLETLKGWWPFKPRGLTQYIIPDAHYLCMWKEKEKTSKTIFDAHTASQYPLMTPMLLKSIVTEGQYKNMIASWIMKAKANPSFMKWALIIAVGIVVFLILHYVLRVF